MKIYLLRCQAGEESGDFCRQHLGQRLGIGDAGQYVSAEAATDIALRVALECRIPQLITADVVFILYADCINETPPDIVDPHLTLQQDTEWKKWSCNICSKHTVKSSENGRILMADQRRCRAA